MFCNLKILHESGERNWWSEVASKMVRFGLSTDLSEVESTSKHVFAKKVRDAIEETAFLELSKECTSLKKTCDLQYTFRTTSSSSVLFS